MGAIGLWVYMRAQDAAALPNRHKHRYPSGFLCLGTKIVRNCVNLFNTLSSSSMIGTHTKQ